MSTSQTLQAYALTDSDRVKSRLGITGTAFDTVITIIIAGVTDLIEGECGGIRFKETTYTNEVYSIYGANQKFIQLKQAPVGTVTAVQYRAGLKSDPNWTDFATDDWDLVGDGGSGLIRVYGLSSGINAVRV